ncbi:MAG: PDZ domain-containing protein [Acidobacteriota bacterium]
MRFLLTLFLALLSVAAAGAIDITDTRLIHQPAQSDRHIAFVYAGDLWVANHDGSSPRRLTSHVGRESSPYFSPDGSLIAFTALYDGNDDVYVIPVAGGAPTRLTWHPSSERVEGFTPDGDVLFISSRNSHTGRFAQLFKVSPQGGFPEQLPLPNVGRASLSPDGSTLVYVPGRDVFGQWKNYRGGSVSRLWLVDMNDWSVVEVPQPAGRSNDTDPSWLDNDRVVFRSDRNGEFNLFAFDRRDGSVNQLTRHDDFPVIDLQAAGGTVLYEQAGWLHRYDSASSSTSRVPVGIAADLVELRSRWVTAEDWLTWTSLSPSGARAVISARGDVLTVPAKKGSARQLTETPGAHERTPVWSPDGADVAYFSDESGEYRLHVEAQDGRGEARAYDLDGEGFYENPAYSPDGTKLSFSDNSRTTSWIDLDSGAVTDVAADVVYGPNNTISHDWSPDSRWLAAAHVSSTYFGKLFLHDTKEGVTNEITDGLSDVADPAFDASGKYLFFTASTDSGPVRSWFAMSNADFTATNQLYLAVLSNDEPSPFAPESDEQEVEEADSDDAEDEAESEDGEEAEAEDDEGTAIDLDGLGQRIIALPVGPAYYSSLETGTAGKLFYLRHDEVTPFGAPGPGSLAMFDLDAREETVLSGGVVAFDVSADRNKLLVIRPGGQVQIVDAGAPFEPGSGAIDLSSARIRVEPTTEWRQIYHEAWRMNRDYFYDPGMHGADWPAMRTKYEEFLPHLSTRDDLNRVMTWLFSELAVGHHFLFGGDSLADGVESVPVGLLGADYEVAYDRYRVARVLSGLNWNPNLRAPLTAPGVDVEVGDYLITIDGVEVRASDNLYSFFEGKLDQLVEIEVASNPEGEDARLIEVVPVGNERGLRNRAWVEGNLAKVHEATGGRVAYVYVPDTANLGHVYFKRYFYPQTDKEAIIVDERYNGGGQVADYYIDALRRPMISNWAMRYGEDVRTPISSIMGPKVMLIDENAGSGGDLLPWMFRKLDMGPLIGKATWGGLVGILGFPGLIDGGFVTAPNLAIWTEDGFVVENVGVPPDIEVEQWPADVIAGRDPQLEKAIEVVLEMLEDNPPVTPERPAFPIRVRQ